MPEPKLIQLDGLDLKIPESVEDLADTLTSKKKLEKLNVSPKTGCRVYKAEDAIKGEHEETLASGFKVTLGGSAGGKFEICAFNSPDDKDPDKVVRTEDDQAWLKYGLAADAKGSAGVASGNLKFGLDASLGLRLLQYRSHRGDETLGAAVRSDLKTYQFAVRESDVLGLADGDALAYLVNGTLAFSAQLSWSDILSSSVKALDEALGVDGVSAFKATLGAKVGFTVGASDDYRLIFRGMSGSTTLVELQKTKTRKLGVNAELGLEVGFSDPKALEKALNDYLSGRLGIDKAKALVDKIDSAVNLEDLDATQQALAQRAAEALGLDDLQDWWKELKKKVEGLWAELEAVVKKVANVKVKAGFQAAYARVETDQTLLKCELAANRLSEHHEQLLRGNFSELVDALAADSDGYTLLEYLRTEIDTRTLSFGFSLSIGSWAAGSKSVNKKMWTRQINIQDHERVSFEGQKTYTGTWGAESYRYGFELAGSMSDFSAAVKANCSELDYTMGFNWNWSQKLDGSVLRNALDLAAVWGILSEAQADAAFAAAADLMDQEAVVEVELGFSNQGVHTLLDVDRDDLDRLWTTGLAAALPRIVGPGCVFRASLAERVAVYGQAAEFAFDQKSGVDSSAVLSKVDYRGQPDPKLRRTDFGEDRSGVNYVRSLPVLWNLGSTNAGTLPAGIAKRTFKALNKFNRRVNAGGKKEAVADAYGKLQDLFSKKPYNMRVAGYVFSNIVREDGGPEELTGSVKVTAKQDGKVVLIA